ncbi:hypothetical protein Tco_1417905 [Tanacetum coccineum]
MKKVEKYVTKTLGAEVLARSSNQPQSYYAIVESLTEFELKKIIIDKIEEIKSMNRSDVQKNLYNALIESYKSDKDILTSYGEVVTLKQGRDDQDKDEEPSTRSNRGSKQRRLGKEDSSKEVTQKESKSASSSKGGNSSRKYITSITKTKAVDYGHVKWIKDKIPRSTWSEVQVVYDKHAYWGTYHWGPKRQRFYGYATNMETSKDVYSKHMIIAITSLKIMEFFGYKHLEEITGKLTNLNMDKRFALNVALRMYTRRIVIQERVEDLQLAFESYQKKINLTKPDIYHSNISKKTPYTAYHDIQGIIYQDDMNRNRLMRTDELHKFSDGTLNHVRTSLNDIATGIQMEYLPKRKWSKQDKQRARVMIKAIDKKLKDRRLMRSLKKFVGGRPYRGDLRLLQRTI